MIYNNYADTDNYKRFDKEQMGLFTEEFLRNEDINVGKIILFIYGIAYVCNMTIAGRATHITFYDTHDSYGSELHPIRLVHKDYLNFWILDYFNKDGMIYDYDGIELSLTSFEQLELLKKHVKEQNTEAKENFRALQNAYDETRPIFEGSLDSYIEGFINHFLTHKYQYSILLFSLIDAYVKQEDSSLEWYLKMDHFIASNALYTNLYDDHPSEYDNESKKIGEKFLMLIDLISKKIGENRLKSTYFTYIRFWELLTIIRATEWEEKYGIYFLSCEQDFEAHIRAYCAITEFDIKDAEKISSFVLYLTHKDLFEECSYYNDIISLVINSLEAILKEQDTSDFEKLLLEPKETNTINVFDVDLMNGYEFELFVAELFTKMGYTSRVTKSSGDQGIDVIANKNGRSIGIQAKKYSKPVGNAAVQELVAGLRYYNLDTGIVITNNYFTKSANELAQANNVTLWNRDVLSDRLKDFSF